MPIQEECRELGVRQQTFCRWKKKSGAMAPSEIKRLKQLEEENRRLRAIAAT